MSVQYSSASAQSAPEPNAVDDTVAARFFVTADADPGIVPRLVEPFSKMGIVPTRIHVSSEDGDGSEFSADLRASGITRETAHLIDKALRRIIGVRQVIAVNE